MKKIYSKPSIEVIESEIEAVLYQTTIDQGDDDTGGNLPIEGKGTSFEDEEDDWEPLFGKTNYRMNNKLN